MADETAAFWQQMAAQFADHSNVLYEVFNEPMNFSDTSWAHFKRYAQPWVDRPVIITEWGFRQQLNGGTQTSFGAPLKSFIEAHGLSWTAWCASGIWTEMMFDGNWNLLVGEGEMGGSVKDWLAERKDQDQPALAPAKCATITATDGAVPTSTSSDAAPQTSPDASPVDTKTCIGTPSGPGSEPCSTQPDPITGIPCLDTGRVCDYPGCGDLAMCTCQSDQAGTGQPTWQCTYYLR